MIRGEAAFDNQEGIDEFPSTMKRIIEEKRYLTEQDLMQAKVPCCGKKKMPQRIFISKEEKWAPLS